MTRRSHHPLVILPLQSSQDQDADNDSEGDPERGRQSKRHFHSRLWINYPYINSEERDFSYLIPQLKKANIEAAYDSFQLMPDVRLWERIVPRLVSIGFDGWLYILTHQCFTRKSLYR